MTDTIPLVLKFDDWPVSDRLAWETLFVEGDFLGDAGPCHHWSDGSRAKRRQSYGQWVSFLRRKEPDALAEPPAERIQIDRARTYLAECETRLKPTSISNLLGDLYEVAKALAPERDWTWLKRVARRLQHKASSNSLPAAPSISAGEIWRWSLSRLDQLNSADSLPALQRAIEYRQALMIGFLISWPVRRRALLSMTVDRHLQHDAGGITVRFDPEDMKDGKGRTAPLPAKLTGPMNSYLKAHRQVLLGASETPFLWISKDGQPLTADGLSRELPKVTQRYLGVALRPHAFRHIAATSIAEVDPEHVNIIRDILGHATLVMAEKHYNRATGVSSCNALQSIVEDIQKDMPRMGRAKRSKPRAKRRKAK